MRLAPLSIGLTMFAFAMLVMSSSAALAMGHVGLGSHSTNDIKSHCDAAGGSYYNSGGVYGCFGPGGDVTCSGKNGKCFGSCSKCGSAARLSGKGGIDGFPEITDFRIAQAIDRWKHSGSHKDERSRRGKFKFNQPRVEYHA